MFFVDLSQLRIFLCIYWRYEQKKSFSHGNFLKSEFFGGLTLLPFLFNYIYNNLEWAAILFIFIFFCIIKKLRKWCKRILQSFGCDPSFQRLRSKLSFVSFILKIGGHFRCTSPTGGALSQLCGTKCIQQCASQMLKHNRMRKPC